MRKLPGIPRLFLAVAIASAALPVDAATSISSLRRPAPARITIRGSGSAISVDRTGAPEPDVPADESASPVLAEAIGLKASGTSDDALVGYLKAHRDELPAFIDFDTLSALRREGAGRTVVAYLSSVSAVEIGPTGAEGGVREEPESGYGPSPEGSMTNELPADLAWGGWAWGGGGIVNGGFGNSHRHGPGMNRGVGHRRGSGPGPATPRPAPHGAGSPAPTVSRRLPWR